MDSQMAHPHEQDPTSVGLHAGVEGEDEHHHDKKSVLSKVKAKAKKIKDTIKLHGHDHDQHHESHVPDDHDLDDEDDDEEEEEEEMVEDPEIHGPSGLCSEKLGDSKTYYGTPDPMKSVVLGQKEDEGQLKVATGRTTATKEVPPAPFNSPASISPAVVEQTEDTDPVKSFCHEQQAAKGQPEVDLEPTELEEDPHAPKDRLDDYTPANYQTKVTDPTGSGGEEAGITPILRSLDKMNIYDAPKPGAKDQFSVLPSGSHDQFSPELTPPIPMTIQENPESIPESFDSSKPQDLPRDVTAEKPSNQGSRREKISPATAAIVDKAISAKNVVASKIGYGHKDNSKEHEVQEAHDTAKTESPVDHGKKIAATATEKLTPVYDKVAEVGSTIISKVHGTGTSTGNEAEGRVEGQDKGVSMKDYFAEKLRPGEDDRALSEVILEVLSKRKAEAEKADHKPRGKVTESEEVKRQLGSMDDEYSGGRVDPSSVHIPGKSVVDKLKNAVGSWFVKGQVSGSSQQPLGSSTGTEGFSASASGEERGERRLQESGN